MEEERVKNVQQRLREIDREIDRLLDLLENENLLEETYLLLTTDHGDVYKRQSLKDAKPYESFQFVRQGFFCVDYKDSKPGEPVFNLSLIHI